MAANNSVTHTNLHLMSFLERNHLFAYLSEGYVHNNVNRVGELSWIVSGVFRLTMEERERIWRSTSLLERLVLLN